MKLWLKKESGEEQEYFDIDVLSFTTLTVVSLVIIYSTILLFAFFVGVFVGLGA